MATLESSVLAQPAAPAGPAIAPAATCTRCGSLLPGGRRYCTVCGTAGPLALGEAHSREGKADESASPTEIEQITPVHPTRLTVEEALAFNPIFRLLPPDVRRLLAGRCFRRRYKPGEWVIHEGQPSERVFLVASGRAHASVAAGRGRRALVRPLAPGDLLGETAVVADETAGRPVVSVEAMTPVETYVFPAQTLADAARGTPAFREAVVRHAEASRVEAFLRRASPFAPLPPAVLLQVAGGMRVVRYQSGEVVFNEGDPGDAVYVVRLGTVEVIAGGNRVATLRVGDCFGEAALLTGQARGATIQAAEPSELLRLDREDFDRVLAEYEQVRGFFIELLRRRDLLTPSLARVAAQPARAAVEAEAAAGPSINYGPTRTVALAAVAGSGLLVLLASTPRGGYLLAPAVAAALAATPAIGVVLFRALGLAGEVPVPRHGILALVGVVAALATTVLAAPADVAVGYRLQADAVTACATASLFTVALAIAGGRRGYRQEIDGMVAGATLGLAFGLTGGLARWIGISAAGPTVLTLPEWYNLLTSPAIPTMAGAILGAGIWAIRHRSPLRLVWALFVAAAVFAFARVPDALRLPPLGTLLALSATAAGAFLVARVHLHTAMAARAATRTAFSLSGTLAAEGKTAARILCRVCGTPASAGEVYCSRCGQSLLRAEDE